MLNAALEKWGYEPVEALNGVIAWDILRREDSPCLAILDWIMPEMDGLEVVRRVRALEKDCPPYILLLTGRRGKDNIVKGLEAGADDYLVKPFDPDELRARVRVGRRMVRIQKKLLNKITELNEARTRIHNLEKILPICSFCKKIRDETGRWEQMELYVAKKSGTAFSHSVCPECAKKHYGEFL